MSKQKYKIPARMPDCYGLLHDLESEDCACCLIRKQCESAMDSPKIPKTQILQDEESDAPKNKKLLTLAVLRKFGIPAMIKGKESDSPVEITEENLDNFYSIECVLTTKAALNILLKAKLAEE